VAIAFVMTCCACESANEFLIDFVTDADVDMFNESDIAVNLLAPGEAASPDNLVQPGQGRVATVQYETAGQVTFRATNDQGFLVIATCTFANRIYQPGRTGEVVFTSQRVFDCRGELFGR
jgi:hypothetical protein